MLNHKPRIPKQGIKPTGIRASLKRPTRQDACRHSNKSIRCCKPTVCLLWQFLHKGNENGFSVHSPHGSIVARRIWKNVVIAAPLAPGILGDASTHDFKGQLRQGTLVRVLFLFTFAKHAADLKNAAKVAKLALSQWLKRCSSHQCKTHMHTLSLLWFRYQSIGILTGVSCVLLQITLAFSLAICLLLWQLAGCTITPT